MYSRTEIDAVLRHQGRHCVSIYAPTEQRGRETRKNSIVLKDALREAHSQLLAAGADEKEADAILAPLAEMQADNDFHQHMGQGFAAFLAPDFSWRCTVPVPFTDTIDVSVGQGFHIRPLLPLLSGDGRFYVLAFDREHVHLYAAGRHGMRELKEDLPEDWMKVRGMTDYEQQTGFHASGPGPSTSGGVAVTHHAHGESPEELRKQETDAFVRDLAHAVASVTADDNDVPVVLCAEPELRGLYRKHARDGSRDEWEVDAHPGSLDDDELHRRAYEAVEPHFRRIQQDAAESYAALRGTGDKRADNAVETAVPAACQGRVETLFVARDKTMPGIVNQQTQQASPTDRDLDGAVDLLETAVRETLMHGGRAFVVAPDQVPGGGALAAVYRY